MQIYIKRKILESSQLEKFKNRKIYKDRYNRNGDDKILDKQGNGQVKTRRLEEITTVPTYKEGDSRKCENYRQITVISVPGKLYARKFEKRSRERVD